MFGIFAYLYVCGYMHVCTLGILDLGASFLRSCSLTWSSSIRLGRLANERQRPIRLSAPYLSLAGI